LGDKANITPKVFKWARESARLSPAEAAAKAGVNVEKLLSWEDGTDQPTIKKAEALAKAYRRPFAVLFLPDIPRDFQPLRDFRRKSAKALGRASTFIIREIQQKQAWISEVLQEEDQPLPFVGRFTLQSNTAEVAEDILQTLSIDPRNYTLKPIREWIDKAEAQGLFVSRTSFIHSKLKLDSDELQGFAVADKYAPFVFVNSEDWDAPQLFTLVHEIAHIWIGESGISNEVDVQPGARDSMHPVELFCNQVAAETLMPAEILQKTPVSAFTSGETVFKAAEKMGISSFAFLVRSLSMGLINPTQYRKLKREADAGFQLFLERDRELVEKRQARAKIKPGGPDYYLLLTYKNGIHFTKVVIDAFRVGAIQPTEASSLLNTQVTNFSKIEALLYK
jgi:Zn-dependent peptidase ImmA (M78 family)/DNA-binding XRE family transcriptional regulator